MSPRAAVAERLRSLGTGLRRRRSELGLFALLAVLLLPIGLFPLFPSQDGPSHVANASLLVSLLRGDAGPAAEIYRPNLEPFPNWFTHASLAALLAVLPPAVAEKALLSAFVVMFVLAFRYALGALDSEAGALAGLCLPFVYDRSLHLGYYNRSFALVPLLLALGLWLRRKGRLGRAATAGLAALLLWLYFCSATSLLVAWLGLGVLLLAVTLDERAAGAAGRGRAAAARVLALAAASLPALLLLLRFESRQGAGVAGPGEPWLERLRALVTLDWLVALDPRERWLSGTLAALLASALVAAAAARLRRGRGHWRDGLLAAAGLAGIGYFAAPSVAIVGHGPWGGPVHDRIAPLIPLLLLLWLAAQPLPNRLRRGLLVASIAVGLGFIALRLPRYAALNEQLAEYLSVSTALPRGATLLPLSFAHQGRDERGRPLAHASWPFRHAADWLVLSRGLLSADNYEAQVSFFPVVLRPGYDPYRLLGSSLDRLPACVRLGRFNRLAPRPAEFVLLWGARWAERGDPCGEELFRTLDTQYRRVFVSSPRGEAEVYRRSASGRTPD